MSELNHLRKKPPDDGGLLLDTKDRRLKMECEECGVLFYIGPEETSQQRYERRATLRRSINAAKTKMRRLRQSSDAREARLQADRANKESQREVETEDARTSRLQGQALRQDRLRQTETEDAWTSRLQGQALRQDRLRQTETKDARTTRLQEQAQRQQCMRDNIITSETAENRLKRLQNEARRKKASRAMSPARSQDSSDSDVVMEDVDSSSSDESSDESMNDNIQMTSDTSSHSKLPGMLTDKLEVDQKVESALKHLILRTLNGDAQGVKSSSSSSLALVLDSSRAEACISLPGGTVAP
ncbi:hypothetical protein THAOC_32029 [Thalassiosira oceanica]|uniref:Uncharacterized protein n=1 Tax=Thalassiosira oceanica TaxID=159749 RepID=K0R820_THAOC|nr:hypothetical protein THAOC_32029 [Thalassiosira oceanica]|eukprot:EJK49125.1 hypothetical protein THAOC_32029 [Thalassiosira oceanica]